MVGLIYITIAAASTVVVLLATGWWRRAFLAFAIRPHQMTVEKLGLMISAPGDVERVNGLLANFAGGFNAMITKSSVGACDTYCASRSVFNRPFAEEGLAMGYTLRHLFRYDAAEFEKSVVRRRPEFRYLYYVGLGFWSGMRSHSPQRLTRIVDGLDPLHRYLCYDGYGFKRAFFDYRLSPDGLDPLCRLEGYARHSAYQGVGRAFWFLYRDRPDVLIEHANKLGEFGADVAAGAALAATFVNPDRLEVAQDLARQMPAQWRDDFHLGMCFALKARSINDLEQFERDLARIAPATRDAVWTSIRECDRIELQVRSETEGDGYRRWRSRVKAWMAENIEYPLARVKTSLARPKATGEAKVTGMKQR